MATSTPPNPPTTTSNSNSSTTSTGKKTINLALLSGDGLPISGLLTTFRNVLDLDLQAHTPSSSSCPPLIRLPIPTDLGYSWRPDKAAFFPRGPASTFYPAWLAVTAATPVTDPGYAAELLRIRRAVALPDSLLSGPQREELRARIDAIAAPYQRHLERWFEENDIDWVVAVNMTLSDAVPVTTALHRAAAQRWGPGCGSGSGSGSGTESGRRRPGGVLFWDHDLLSSYAVHENNERVYPLVPNEFTLVPQDVPWHVWAIVSEVLEPETTLYPTEARALVVPNVLPILGDGEVAVKADITFQSFLGDFELLEGVGHGRPVLLCPNRIFPVKGIEISIRVLAAVKEACVKRGLPAPYLLIFGDPEEDPAYAAELQALGREEGLVDDIRFLGGVPLCSGFKGSKAMLDEKDLLRLAAATHGGVVYTPNTTNVESVGLGPALASIAGLPFVVSKFNALRQVYGDDLQGVFLDTSGPQGFELAAESFVDMMEASKLGSATRGQHMDWSKMAQQNKTLMLKKFPLRPWKDLLLRMAVDGGVDTHRILEAQAALGILESIAPRV
ncbi:group 1 glycosyl transferase [Drepanopeziza brunnea f. sp. 'multigermtubi' MB_m1]|uniref:Group 1 glycosyl transferase n=1 Tax=Marssonina brunnea f. sp. multigermtubi (strain MB_m1) TaxID=1072389 RepID=K1WEV6_MARBU|nr:group 1 glycosyl transferase [Drepanopeziza brunnea f. sp. 'multigermtubi' MB_m1]EKD16000.1 group 1 glycosyl transferase [Drepanopeziza brunnea f. sp. 'multigermtubi' MB_m1]